jgi:peptidoglycan hydrolase CwlO-like protein
MCPYLVPISRHYYLFHSVANKQLLTRIQNERNDKEAFLQAAQLERDLTAVDVNAILLQRDKVLRTAEAEASLKRARAQAQAENIKARARINGTRLLLESSGISTQDHKSAFTYIQTLRERSTLNLGVSYLSPDSVLRTQQIGG